jgi:hypothetical protein
VHRVVTYPEAADQIDHLPARLLPDLAAALDALAVEPWSGTSHNPANPAGEVRRWLFGPIGVGQSSTSCWSVSRRSTCCR